MVTKNDQAAELDKLTRYGMTWNLQEGDHMTALDAGEYFKRSDVVALLTQQAAPEAPTEPLCPACQGSGEGLMMEGQGPDTYEVPCACPYCKGSGGLLDAYHGLVALLDAEREKYLRLCGKAFFASTGAAPEAPANEQQAADHNSQDPSCSCPSGTASLSWPCPAHPPEATTASASEWTADEIAAACVEAGLGVLEANTLIVTLKGRAPAPSRNAVALDMQAGYAAWAADNLPQYFSGHAPTWATVEANVRMETWNAWRAALTQQSAAHPETEKKEPRNG